MFPKQCLHYGVLAELKGSLGAPGCRRSGRHAKSSKNLQFFNIFEKNGAGVRVLRSPTSFFDECFSEFARFAFKIHFGRAGSQGGSKGLPRGLKEAPRKLFGRLWGSLGIAWDPLGTVFGSF